MGSVKIVNRHYQQNNCTSESYKNRSVFIIISEKDNIKWINKKHNLYRLLSRISFLHINEYQKNISLQIDLRFF